MNKEEIEEIETLEIDFKDTDDLELALEVSSKKAIYLIDDLIKYLIELQQENKQLKEQVQDLKADYGTIAQIERDLYKEVIEEVREYIEDWLFDAGGNGASMTYEDINELLQILDKVKD